MPADSEETLVFVPGLGCTERLFAPQIAALGGSRPIRIADHRQDATMEAIARRLLADAPARFALAGLSMGGYIAIEVLRQAPDRVTRVALLDTSARGDTGQARENRHRQMDVARAGRLDALVDDLWPRLVHPDRREDAGLRAIVDAMMRDIGAEGFIRQQHAIMSRGEGHEVLSALEIPTLVLVGDSDVLTPPDAAREMADLVEWSSHVVVPGCGHLSTLERPEPVTDALSAWLAA